VDAADVKTIADRISAIQGDHKPTIDEKPGKADSHPIPEHIITVYESAAGVPYSQVAQE